MENKQKILMAVGRSGGHIYPAIAIAESLEELSPEIEVHFIHSGHEIGKKIFSHLQYPVYEMPIGALATGQSFLTKIKTLFQLPLVFLKSFLLIRKHKFSCVFGTGGAVTGPVILAAFFQGCSTGLWEANSTSGIANRYLSYFVHSIFTVFLNVSGLPKKKIIHCGYPLRQKIENQIKKQEDKKDHSLFKVLILGGSQGSVFLNQVISESLQEEGWREDLFIYHQTGARSYEEIKKTYQGLNRVEAFDFTPHIYDYYKQVDLVFSRAGSGAISEIAACKKPLVLIPLTRSAGGHQLKNALFLHSQSFVELIKEDEFNIQSFKKMILSLKEDKDKRMRLSSSLFQSYQPKGAEKIARWILSQS